MVYLEVVLGEREDVVFEAEEIGLEQGLHQ